MSLPLSLCSSGNSTEHVREDSTTGLHPACVSFGVRICGSQSLLLFIFKIAIGHKKNPQQKQESFQHVTHYEPGYLLVMSTMSLLLK